MGFYFYGGQSNFQYQGVGFSTGAIVAPVYPGSQAYSNEIQLATTNLISVPNIRLLLQISSFVNLLEELSFFTYHSFQYDPGFNLVINSNWNITNAKWIFTPVQQYYQRADSLYLVPTLKIDYNQTPPDKYIEQG